MLVIEQSITLWGLEKLIDGERPDMEVVGKASNADDAKQMIKTLHPDILLLSLRLGGLSSSVLVPYFMKDGLTRVVLFTALRDLDNADRAVINGVSGLVCKEDSPQTLISAIKKVHAGEMWLDRSETSNTFSGLNRRAGDVAASKAIELIASLTVKERTIMEAFAKSPGAKNKNLAETLFISDHTLRNNLTTIYAKLNIANRWEFYEFAKLYNMKR